ncbi:MULTISPECIES: ABC transporter ATP-binding protein [Actinomycetes]|uniref:ABC transporter domain-containing protein n=2 Tax=Actinomycetes TaxID=1760 RepID=A0ABP6M276_9MICC
MTALHVDALTRSFITQTSVTRVALSAVDLILPRGGVHALLGPNGAGKTTLCRIASTVLLPTSGTCEVLGHDVVADARTVRRLIGIVFGGDRGLYERLTAEENLRFWCSMHGLRRRAATARIAELLERLGLASRGTERVETFSRGMKQRLHLARGLVADPQLLILDEPTVGMDPISAREFRGLITELRQEGRSVLLTTHDLAEAEALADTVTMIDRGSILRHLDAPPAAGTLEPLYFELLSRTSEAGASRGMEV